MIKSIHIKNFKSIKEKTFSLSNLNILVGLNGMGKSSFIQSLLLMRQSENIGNGKLNLNGNYIYIGCNQDALYQFAKDEEMCFDIAFTKASEKPYKLHFKFSDPNADTLHQTNEDYLDSDIAEESLFSGNFQYLNADRLNPQTISEKNHSVVVNSKHLGNHGEYTPHFINEHGDKPIEFVSLLHRDSVQIDEITKEILLDKSLLNQINLWLREISPGVTVNTAKIPNADNIVLGYTYKQPYLGSTNQFKPSNVGFGISYVLSVITAILSTKDERLLIIENPESHLHPKGQAALGRLIALACRNNVQIIIETHSDHVINGIRVAIKDFPDLSQRTSLFFFDKMVTAEEQFSDVTDIKIDKHGELDNYPPNFLSEWGTQLSRLF